MESATGKITKSVIAAPIGAAIGAVAGYLVAKHFGYHKTLSVIGFTMVGLIIGSSLKDKF